MNQLSTAPRVTVLLPVYNGARFLAQSIESILRQSFDDFELLVINDGSTDGSREVVLSFRDARIRLIDNEANLGLVASLNKGIGLARGEYLARMDQDDIAMPERLARQVTFLDSNPQISVLGTWAEKIDEAGVMLGYSRAPTGYQMEYLWWQPSPLLHPTVMIRLADLGAARYDPDLPYAEDYGLWLCLRAAGKRLHNLPECLLEYRVHAENMSILGRQRQLGSGHRAFVKYLGADFVTLADFLSLINCAYEVCPVRRIILSWKLAGLLGHPYVAYVAQDARYLAGWLKQRLTSAFKQQ